MVKQYLNTISFCVVFSINFHKTNLPSVIMNTKSPNDLNDNFLGYNMQFISGEHLKQHIKGIFHTFAVLYEIILQVRKIFFRRK